MMVTIYKYYLSDRITIVPMPENAEILAVHEQGGNVYLWARVDTDSPTVSRRFETVGTGWPIEYADSKYIGTAFLYDATYVLHVFEVK